MEKILYMKSTNFEFLRPENDNLANLAALAEAVAFIDPGSALTRLRGFAEEVTKAIYKEEKLPRLPQATFYELIKSSVFESCVNKSLIHQINFLRVQGNETAHGGEGDARNTQVALGIAHQLAMYMGIRYYGKAKNDISTFKELQSPSVKVNQLEDTVKTYEYELRLKEEQLNAILEELDKERLKKASQAQEPTTEQQHQRKNASQSVADSLQWNEAKTRALLIDAMLIQAGWDVHDKQNVSLEFEVKFSDNASGKGYADYVLWGNNGQPLAVVEAKKSGNTSLQAGREQARLYADALENMGYVRPVIFYTNGYETFIWDDKQYNT